MKLSRRHLLYLVAAAAALAPASRPTWAQTYPSRPITIVVPFPAGGPTDTLARILADRMRQPLGQPVIVENPTGAGGTIGTGRVGVQPHTDNDRAGQGGQVACPCGDWRGAIASAAGSPDRGRVCAGLQSSRVEWPSRPEEHAC
jgi:tripartite-type tricarboxylate transporter receptor subunit TctC